MLSNKTVAITGASGYIGAPLVDKLLTLSVDVIRISGNKLTPKQGVKDFTLDLLEQSSWLKIVKNSDTIIHLSADTSAYTAEAHPNNSLMSTQFQIKSLIKAAMTEGCIPKVVFASTATVYGLTDLLPVKEYNDKSPITAYDLHKLFSEQALAMATRNGVVSAISLRLANVYGPSNVGSRSRERGILNKVANMALQGNDLAVYGDGEFVRDYVYIDDVVDAFIAAANLGVEGIGSYNIATQVGHSLVEAFTMIGKRVEVVTNRKINILRKEWPEGINKIEKRNFIGDISKYKELTGWEPKVFLEEGINKMIESFR